MADVVMGENIKNDLNKDIQIKESKEAKVTPVNKTKNTKKKDDEPRCLACKRTAKHCGYDGTNTTIESLQTYHVGKFICEKCWEKAGYPMGYGEELLHRILIILELPLDQ